jgi:hypothetical protein
MARKTSKRKSTTLRSKTNPISHSKRTPPHAIGRRLRARSAARALGVRYEKPRV